MKFCQSMKSQKGLLDYTNVSVQSEIVSEMEASKRIAKFQSYIGS